MAEFSKNSAQISSANFLPPYVLTISYSILFSFNSSSLSNKSNLFSIIAYMATFFPIYISTYLVQKDNSSKVDVLVMSFTKRIISESFIKILFFELNYF